MKTKPILSLVLAAAGLLTLSSAAEPARAGTPRNSAAAAPSSCDDENAKARLYKKFLDNYKGNPDQQKVAYEAGKAFILRYESCPEDSDKNVVGYVRKWVAKYEEAVREWRRRHGGASKPE